MMLRDLAILSIRSPREGMRAVLNLNIRTRTALVGLALVAVLSALLLHLSLLVSPGPAGNPLVDALASRPLQTAVVQGVMLLAMALTAHVAGRAWGGQGTFGDSVVMIGWLQGFFVVLQAVQVVGLVTLPPLAGLVGLVSIVLFFWLLTQFVTEVHGFTSPTKVFLGIVLTVIAMSFLLTFVLVAILGPEAFSNV